MTQAAAPSIDWNGLACEIKERACALGFDLAGIAAAEPSGYRDYFRAWLAEGQAGEMAYLQNRFDQRTDPATYMPGARSVICVALNYHVSLRPTDPDEADLKGRIARYALGDDYHEVIKSRLHELADWVRRTVPGCQTRAAVDTAPIMEKELAARAGIGWLGKNTCIIHPRIGSWIVLGEIVTDLPLPPDAPVADHCGSCTRCIDACPTAAITAPYQLDARRCISYLTIEHRGEIEAELKPRVGDWLFGCDICQEVCPFNRRSPDTADLALQPRFPAGSLDAGVILTWTPDTYREKLRHSAMKRVKLPILQRNAAMVTQNHREDSD